MHAYLSYYYYIIIVLLIVYDLCGSMVIYIQSPHGLMRSWPMCSLGAGAKYWISHCCQVSEFNYRSGQLCTSNEEVKCPKYKTECTNILLHKWYIELKKLAYFTVKIISYFAWNKILNKNENCYVIN